MASSVVRRVKQYRDKMQALGFRPLQMWVPDTKRLGFAAECRRQSLALRDAPAARDLHAWIDASADTEGWQ